MREIFSIGMSRSPLKPAPDPENVAADRVNGGRNGRMQADIKRQALNQPFLQKVLDMFEGAEVRDVIPRESKAHRTEKLKSSTAA